MECMSWLEVPLNTELTMFLRGRRPALLRDATILSYRYRYSTRDLPVNRHRHVLGNPRNGMRISVTRLQHLLHVYSTD